MPETQTPMEHSINLSLGILCNDLFRRNFTWKKFASILLCPSKQRNKTLLTSLVLNHFHRVRNTLEKGGQLSPASALCKECIAGEDTRRGANWLSSEFSPTLAHINVPAETILIQCFCWDSFFSDLFICMHFSCFFSFSLYFQSFGTGIHCSFPSSPSISQVHSLSLSTFYMFSPFTLWILRLFCFHFPSSFLLITPFLSHLQPFLFVLFLPPPFLSLLSRLRVTGVEFYIFFLPGSLLLDAICLPPPSQVGSRA